MGDLRGPVGVVLAGGLGRRLGGGKATAMLSGRPLLCYPLTVLSATLGEAAVVAKADTELPDVGTTPVWIEPDQPRHPLVGIITALERAGERAVVVCACDLPLVGAALIAELGRPDRSGARASITTSDDGPQPLLGRYEPAARAPLEAMLRADPAMPLRVAVGRLEPRIVAVTDRQALFNVNTAEDLERAAALLASRK
jgi:molybdopterin-guanine dinucleotide biosynthesis protein A